VFGGERASDHVYGDLAAGRAVKCGFEVKRRTFRIYGNQTRYTVISIDYNLGTQAYQMYYIETDCILGTDILAQLHWSVRTLQLVATV